ncbi:unnamed protein product [Larinioides sclopetarius]|uniref:Uncharacterized protein n=1 Tax=Larinioides sclopetarius TaxID=280406 RepID=A0AAV1YTF2_9ARAC
MERAVHWSIWSASIFYSLFKFKKSSEYHPRYSPDDFSKGWNIFSLETMKDNSDLEWLILTSTFKRFYLILLFQVICTQIILRINKYMQKSSRPIPLKEFISRFLHLLFCRISWYFVYELFLLFIYSSAVQFYPDQVANYDSWALCGLGYALPMMFFLKYFVLYGTANAIGKLEGFELPPPPKCISCIHQSSFLWRHFDRGLYLWILKYLYHPVINSQWKNMFRKILALGVCFGFVCIWHGMDKSICVSSTMNCLLVASEIIVKFILTTRSGKTFEKLPTTMKIRISAALSTPHFLMMCLSCCFFLSNFEIGMLLVKRIFSGDVYPLVPLLIIMYCGCHVSMDSKEVAKKTI